MSVAWISEGVICVYGRLLEDLEFCMAGKRHEKFGYLFFYKSCNLLYSDVETIRRVDKDRSIISKW